MHNDDEYLFPPTQYDERERSQTPPLFAYSTYPPPPEDVLLAPYTTAQSYRPLTAEVYPDYLAATVPATLPSMTHFSDAIKRTESGFPGDDSLSLSPYNMNYGSYMPGLDLSAGAPSPYDHSNPHVSSSRLPPAPAACTKAEHADEAALPTRRPGQRC